MEMLKKHLFSCGPLDHNYIIKYVQSNKEIAT